MNSQGTPLLERFALSYASSATTWHAALTLLRTPNSSPKLLVLANPQFDAERRFEKGPSVPGQRPITVPDRPITVPDRPITVPDRDLCLPRGTRLVDLPGTHREADALAKRFPRATIYTRSKAQESAVKRHAKGTRWLHIATHAFVNDAAPLLSSVVLANPTVGSGEDGFLTAREIFDLDLSGVELVVLSACNTARGKTEGGEGGWSDVGAVRGRLSHASALAVGGGRLQHGRSHDALLRRAGQRGGQERGTAPCGAWRTHGEQVRPPLLLGPLCSYREPPLKRFFREELEG